MYDTSTTSWLRALAAADPPAKYAGRAVDRHDEHHEEQREGQRRQQGRARAGARHNGPEDGGRRSDRYRSNCDLGREERPEKRGMTLLALERQ